MNSTSVALRHIRLPVLVATLAALATPIIAVEQPAPVTPPTADKLEVAAEREGALTTTNAAAAKIELERIPGGATVVDADIPSVVDKERENNLLLWSVCAGDEGKGFDADCSSVFKYGMKRDFNKWLVSLGDAAPVKSLTDLRIWNITHTRAGALRYGQTILDVSDEMDVERDRTRYERDRAKDLRLTATHGIDEVMRAQKLDALLFGGSWGAGIAAKPGYPTVIVPFGFVPNAPKQAYPEKFSAKPIPFGISFTGMECSEPTLLRLAYAFEQATKKRVPPPGMK